MQKLTTRLNRFHSNVDNQIVPLLVEVNLDICSVIFSYMFTNHKYKKNNNYALMSLLHLFLEV